MAGASLGCAASVTIGGGTEVSAIILLTVGSWTSSP